MQLIMLILISVFYFCFFFGTTSTLGHIHTISLMRQESVVEDPYYLFNVEESVGGGCRRSSLVNRYSSSSQLP